MPLPQALAAKLAKRGIIKIPSQQTEPEPEVANNNLQEEIIAEDYDETPQAGDSPVPAPPESFDKFQGWYSCPNKWNVFHECIPACQEQWKDIVEVDKEYNKRRLKMLLKYPLPEHWEEILDVGIRRYYYWNTETDLVSWLPPGHPKCRVSLSAAQLRKQMIEEREERLNKETKEPKRGSEEEEEESSEDEEEKDKEKDDRKRKRKASSPKDVGESGDSTSESSDEGKPPKEKKEKDKRERDKRTRIKERGRGRRERKGNRKPEDTDALDPMDPAAYSECPRGTWASGLPERNEARTGVDPTATGPLFQMRPYPNPGAVLRANSAVNSVGPKKPS